MERNARQKAPAYIAAAATPDQENKVRRTGSVRATAESVVLNIFNGALLVNSSCHLVRSGSTLSLFFVNMNAAPASKAITRLSRMTSATVSRNAEHGDSDQVPVVELILSNMA